MKTPREILLARHRAAIPKLDRVRQDLIAEMARRERPGDRPHRAPNPSLPLTVAFKLWRELFLPSRSVWAGLAAVWAMILLFNLGSTSNSVTTAEKRRGNTEALRTALEQRQQFLKELALLPVTATEPMQSTPQPRSDCRREVICG